MAKRAWKGRKVRKPPKFDKATEADAIERALKAREEMDQRNNARATIAAFKVQVKTMIRPDMVLVAGHKDQTGRIVTTAIAGSDLLNLVGALQHLGAG